MWNGWLSVGAPRCQSVRDCRPAGHVVWSISNTIDRLDLSQFHDLYREGGTGEHEYRPARERRHRDILLDRPPSAMTISSPSAVIIYPPGNTPTLRRASASSDDKRSTVAWSPFSRASSMASSSVHEMSETS